MKLKRNYKGKTYYYEVDSKDRARYPSDNGFDVFFKGDHPDNRPVKEWAYKVAEKLKMKVLEYKNGDEIEYIFTKEIVDFYRQPKRFWYPEIYKKIQ